MLKLVKYLRKIEKLIEKEEHKRLVFRGQENFTWPIASGAARRLKENKTPHQSDFIKYHKVLLKDARDSNLKSADTMNENINRINDLELLANIQHFGGATCLTDFTTNFLIALWFATASHKEEIKTDEKSIQTDEKPKETEEETDGAVFVINLKSYNNSSMFKNAEPYFKNNQIDKILTYKYGNGTRTKQLGGNVIQCQHFI